MKKRIPINLSKKAIQQTVDEMREMLDKNIDLISTANSDINVLQASKWNNLTRVERLDLIESIENSN